MSIIKRPFWLIFLLLPLVVLAARHGKEADTTPKPKFQITQMKVIPANPAVGDLVTIEVAVKCLQGSPERAGLRFYDGERFLTARPMPRMNSGEVRQAQLSLRLEDRVYKIQAEFRVAGRVVVSKTLGVTPGPRLKIANLRITSERAVVGHPIDVNFDITCKAGISQPAQLSVEDISIPEGWSADEIGFVGDPHGRSLYKGTVSLTTGASKPYRIPIRVTDTLQHLVIVRLIDQDGQREQEIRYKGELGGYDLEILGLMLEPFTIVVGDTISATVRVRNNGGAWPSSPETSLYLYNGLPNLAYLRNALTVRKTELIGVQTIPPLAPEAEWSCTFSFSVKDEMVLLCAKADSSPGDSNRANNLETYRFRPQAGPDNTPAAWDVHIKACVITYRNYEDISLSDEQIRELEGQARRWAQHLWERTLCLRIELDFLTIDRRLDPTQMYEERDGDKVEGYSLLPEQIEKDLWDRGIDMRYGSFGNCYFFYLLNLAQDVRRPWVKKEGDGGRHGGGTYRTEFAGGSGFIWTRVWGQVSTKWGQGQLKDWRHNLYVHESLHSFDAFYDQLGIKSFPWPHAWDAKANPEEHNLVRELMNENDVRVIQDPQALVDAYFIWTLETWPTQNWYTLLQEGPRIHGTVWSTPHLSDAY